MQTHGGDIDRARAAYGGDDWIDLSTGINRLPYPLPHIPSGDWHALPTLSAQAAALAAAAAAYETRWPGAICAGAQGAIDLLPRLLPPGEVRILSPTYSEHGHAFRRAGWRVTDVATFAELSGGDAAVVVTPNNPDGRVAEAASLRALAGGLRLLVVDESFMDPTPEHSLLRGTLAANTLVLRSLGKFYGLAGARIGFAFGPMATQLAEAAGPWPVAGPALTLATTALSDHSWAAETRAKLGVGAPRLDQLGRSAGWEPLGGSLLFRLFKTPNAAAAQERLARAGVWTRRFDYNARWLRLGLPGAPAEWGRLDAALSGSD